MAKLDFSVVGNSGDTVFLLIPKTKAAKAWVGEHIPADAMYLGRGVAVEHRYIMPIVEGILNDGLTVEGVN